MVYYKIPKAFCSFNSVLVVGAICFVLNVTIQGGSSSRKAERFIHAQGVVVSK